MEKSTVSLINSVKETGQSHAKRMKLNQYFIPYTKMNSKWIKDLNIRTPRGKSIGSKLSDTGIAISLWT